MLENNSSNYVFFGYTMLVMYCSFIRKVKLIFKNFLQSYRENTLFESLNLKIYKHRKGKRALTNASD
jgi:hypothetical protein